jgi:hypothetical protein
MKISRLRETMLPFMGTIVILAWILIVGPLGGILIGAAAYFMLVENTFAAVICAAVLMLPAVLTIIWGCGAWTEAILNKAASALKDESTVPLSLTQRAE